jgi:hypothetical protein
MLGLERFYRMMRVRSLGISFPAVWMPTRRVRGDHLGIGGSYLNQIGNGKLMLFNGNQSNSILTGRTVLEPRTWHHVVFVRDSNHVTILS